MAIEKQIDLEEVLTGVPMPDGEDVTQISDDEIEVEITDTAEMEAAEAMGLLEDEEMLGEEFNANLAEILSEEDLQLVSGELLEGYTRDKDSRGEYDNIAEEGVTLLGFTENAAGEPFPGACSATHPVLAQAVVKFQAKTYKELFPTEGPVRTRIIGADNIEKQEQANRVRHFMNWQTQIQMPEYGPELDRLLFYVSLYGTAFKKTWWDPSLQRARTEYIKASDFYVDYFASDLETAERFTHKYVLSKNQIRKLQIAGMFRDVEVMETNIDEDAATETANEIVGRSRPGQFEDEVEILEIHANIDMPGFENEDGLQLPYIIHMTTDEQVLCITRNWDEGDVLFKKKMYFTQYTMIPGLGFYGYGYLHLIGGLTKTATSSMRQLIDAGTFANLPGGFKAHGLRVLAPDEPIAPGEWREVNSPAGDLQKSLQPLPFKEPSGTLFNLMQYVTNLAKEFADATDTVVENSSNYGPVGTTMALLEQSSKLFNAVHKRLHAAQSKDLRILARIDSEYLPDMYPYEVAGGAQQVFKEDFNLKSIDVIPVSDPNMPTEAHRIAKINAIMSIAQQNPAAYNMQQISMELFAAMGVEEPQRYLAQTQEPMSANPITENMAAMKGMPLQAQMEQNHDAHIVTHGTILRNPSYKENPQLQQILMGHITEHLAMKYQQEMMQMIQDPQAQQALMMAQQQGQPLPMEMQNQIAMMAANASDKVLQFDEEKAKIMAGDNPSTEEERMELQRKDLALRAQGEMNRLKIHQDKMDLEEAKLMTTDENEDEDRALRLKEAEMKFASNMAKDAAKTMDAAVKITRI
jgi:hypothetical protein